MLLCLFGSFYGRLFLLLLKLFDLLGLFLDELPCFFQFSPLFVNLLGKRGCLFAHLGKRRDFLLVELVEIDHFFLQLLGQTVFFAKTVLK